MDNGQLKTGRPCPFIGDPFDECYPASMNSQNVEPAIYYCGDNYKECEIYKKKNKDAAMYINSKLFAALMAILLISLFCEPVAFSQVPGGSLDPAAIEKYVEPLTVPPAMPKTGVLPGGIDYYEIAVRQFAQQVLPPGMPMTTLWSYGSVNQPGAFSYPARTIEATANRAVHVKWINDLVDQDGNYFDIPGLYVWHCHILSHEDNEMMRPICVGNPKGCE